MLLCICIHVAMCLLWNAETAKKKILYMFRALLSHLQKIKLYMYSIWYSHSL